jgi:hypothetical protein
MKDVAFGGRSKGFKRGVRKKKKTVQNGELNFLTKQIRQSTLYKAEQTKYAIERNQCTLWISLFPQKVAW